MTSTLPERVSEAEFLGWPETTDKVELIDGFVVRSPGPTPRHQEALIRMLIALRNWAAGRDVTVLQCPCDVRFAPDRILQPDAFVILERIDYDAKGPITRVPELCVEVLSRDASYDRVTKRLLYASAGVKELWAVSPDGWVERWTGPGLTSRELVTATLRTRILPGFAIEVASLFP